MKKKMKKRGFSCMYMFADDANTGNRRGYCHFLYWKNSVPLIEFIDCDSGVGRLVSITGMYIHGRRKFCDGSRPAALHGPSNSLLRLRMSQVRSHSKAEKHLHIRTSEYVPLRADSLPKWQYVSFLLNRKAFSNATTSNGNPRNRI